MLSPEPTIAAGLAHVEGPAIVALAPGTYEEAVMVPEGVTLWGACARATYIRAPGLAISLVGTATALRSLRARGIQLGSSVDAVVEGVIVEGPVHVIGGARLVADGILLRSTPEAIAGIEASWDATVSLTNSVVENAGTAVRVERGTAVVDNVVIRGGGSGISFSRGELSVHRVLITGGVGEGIRADNAHVVLRDSVVRGTGAGMVSWSCTSCSVERVFLERIVREGIYALRADGLRVADVLLSEAGGVGVSESTLDSTGNPVELTRVMSAGSRSGIAAFEAEVRGSDIFVRGEGTPSYGGRLSFDHANAVLTRVRLEGGEAALFVDGSNPRADGPAVVEIRGLSVLPEAREDSPGNSSSVAVGNGAELTLSEFVIEATNGSGVRAHTGGLSAMPGSARLSNGVIRNAVSEGGVWTWGGLIVDAGASVIADRLLLVDNSERGAGAVGAGSELRLTDSVIADPAMRSTSGGWGLTAEDGGSVDARRVAIVRSALSAVRAENATMSLEDVRIADGVLGRPRAGGIVARESARLTLTRGLIERWPFAAVSVGSATLTMSDTTILDTLPAASGRGGHALLVYDGGLLNSSRLAIEHSREGAIVASGTGSEIHVSDVDVDTTVPRELDQQLGAGMLALRGGGIHATRARLATQSTLGAGAFGEGSRIDLAQASILSTAACPADACGGIGVALGAYDGGTVTATVFVMRDGASSAVQLASGGEMDLESGLVRGFPVGASVQVPGFDLDRLSSDVVYVDLPFVDRATALTPAVLDLAITACPPSCP
jgi:hypothetical protein